MSGKAIRETLAALGVIASMVFVGMEIQQNNKLARGQARQALAEIHQEWLFAYSQDAEMYRLFRSRWVDEAELTEDESGRATVIMISYLRRLENVYFQHKEGLVDDSALNAYGIGASLYFGSREFEGFWSERRATFDPGFADFFEGRLARSDG